MTGFGTCGGAFGSGGVGASPFGSGASLAVASAVQESLNAVLVTFSAPPQMSDPGSIYDARNPANWSLSAVDPYDAVVRLAQWTERVDSLTVRVLFDGPLSAPARYEIQASPTIQDAFGVPIVLGCSAVEFSTFPPTRVLSPFAPAAQTPADLNNPWLLKDAEGVRPTPLGTFQITPEGDYALERGEPYLRKRILRRATTMLGEFFHLPDYGFGQSLKGTIRPDLLRKLAAQAQAQILREPDVATANVTAQLAAGTTDTVILTMRVTDRYGQAEELTVPVRLRGA